MRTGNLRRLFWPCALAKATWNVRLGRVVHWTFVTWSAIAVGAAILGSLAATWRYISDVRAASEWERSHSQLARFEAAYENGTMYEVRAPRNAAQADIEKILAKQVDEFSDLDVLKQKGELAMDGWKPVPIKPDFTLAMALSASALGAALIGRALRYILAGE